MPHKPKVSIIMPVYNGEKYLAAAVESVLCQSFQDFELVCINDGSVDRTAEILDGFKDERIRVIQQPNQGSAAARNRGIQNAQGEYVAFIDADDLWLPQKLEVQVSLLESQPQFGAVYSRCLVVDAVGKTLRWYPARCRSGRALLRDLFLGDFIPMLTLVVRKSCLDRIGLFNESFMFAEDFEFKARLVESEMIACCPSLLAKYRMHTESKSFNPNRTEDELEKIEYLVQRYIELRPLRNRRLAQSWGMRAWAYSLIGEWAVVRASLLKAIQLQPYSVGPYFRLIGTIPGVRLFVPILRSARRMWSRYQLRVWKDTDE